MKNRFFGTFLSTVMLLVVVFSLIPQKAEAIIIPEVLGKEKDESCWAWRITGVSVIGIEWEYVAGTKTDCVGFWGLCATLHKCKINPPS